MIMIILTLTLAHQNFIASDCWTHLPTWVPAHHIQHINVSLLRSFKQVKWRQRFFRYVKHVVPNTTAMPQRRHNTAKSVM